MAEPCPTIEEILAKAAKLYRENFKSDPIFAGVGPGRVNLIGEHTDYNDGFVFPMALPMVTAVVGAKNSTDEIRIFTEDKVVDGGLAAFNRPAITPLTPGDPRWANYVKGVIALFPGEVPGFNAVIVSSVPVGAGLSSSAALEVATCTFLEGITGIKVDENSKVRLCQKAEHTFANVPCGIMDQMISVRGLDKKALFIDCRSLLTEAIELKEDSIVFLIVNSKVRHNLDGNAEYVARRDICYKVSRLIGVTALRDATIKQIDVLLKQEAISDLEYRRARHVIKENLRVYEAAQAIIKRDYDTLGLLMMQSHFSLRLDYEVSCPELDAIVDVLSNTKGVLGCRMTGAGFGGCVVSLVKKSGVSSIIQEVKERYKMSEPEFYVGAPSAGARLIDLTRFPIK